MDMGVGENAGVGVGTDVSVDASVGMELWMQVRASMDVDVGVALLHYVIYRIYLINIVVYHFIAVCKRVDYWKIH